MPAARLQSDNHGASLLNDVPSNPGSRSSKMRFAFLDGLRGWAALIVMLLHVFFGSLPAGDVSALNMGLWWSFNGNYMVGLFFVVSGFALSIAYLINGDRIQLLRIAGGRYFRLLLPILATCLLVSLLLNLGAFPAPEDRTAAYRDHYGFDPTVGHLIWFSFFGVFFDFDFFNAYAGPLWTMSYELIGSYGILLLLAISPNRQWRTGLGIAAAGYLLANESYYSLFFIGVLAAELYAYLDRAGRMSRKTLLVTSLGLLAAGYVLPRLLPASSAALLVAVTLWFFGSMLNPAMRLFLESRFSRFLGFISFPLYLVHEAMIVAVGMPIYMAADTLWGRLLAGFLTAGAAILLALAFTPVNTAAMVLSRRVGNAFVRSLGLLMQRPRSA